MSDENKRNLLYFEAPTMKELYLSMDRYQRENHKRLLSVGIQRDRDTFCCIALTNPVEVTWSFPLPVTVLGGRLDEIRRGLER